MKKVSLIIPVYNREKDIINCYNSILKQTYPNIETIFIDDGSTDNTLNVLKTFTNGIVIHQENKGPAAARKNGFEISSGEYISFLDSDDYLDKKFISNLVSTIEKTNTNICVGRFKVELLSKIKKDIGIKGRKLPTTMDILHQKEYLSALNPCLIAKLFKREYIDLGNINYKANEDISIIYSLYVRARYISYCKEAIYHYQLSDDSQVKKYLYGYKYENLMNTFLPLNTIIESFKKEKTYDMYYESLEMIFIKNIFQRISNINSVVKSSKYRNKFVSLLIDYLDCYFPLWRKNIYYKNNYKLGEITDKYNLYQGRLIINNIKNKKNNITLDEIYKEYQKIETEYEKKYRN